MSENGMLRLEYITDGAEFPVADHNSDSYLLYVGGNYRRSVSRVASSGRLVTKPLPDGTIGFGLFSNHKPSEELAKVLSAIGSADVPEPPVIACLKGRFYIMEKSTALELSGVLESTV